MTTEEAIGLLKHHIITWKDKFPILHFEAVGMAIEALEKQIPKQPIENFYDEDCGEDYYDEGYTYSCSFCDNEVGKYSKEAEEWIWKVDYCLECGQKLKWNQFV